MSISFDKMWKDHIKSLGSISKAYDSSYSLWKDKYQGKKTKKAPEPKETFTQKMLIPGKMYSFIYANTVDLKPGQYVDNWPILLSFGHVVKNDNVYETGIDLNMVPPKIRPFILNKMMDYYGSIIEDNMKKINEGKKGIKAIKIDFMTAQKVLGGTGFESAYVMLRRDLMGKIQVIDYEDWVHMASIYTRGIRGLGIQEIYKKYAVNMGKNVVERATLANKVTKKNN
jgi:hypothetical protein